MDVSVNEPQAGISLQINEACELIVSGKFRETGAKGSVFMSSGASSSNDRYTAEAKSWWRDFAYIELATTVIFTYEETSASRGGTATRPRGGDRALPFLQQIEEFIPDKGHGRGNIQIGDRPLSPQATPDVHRTGRRRGNGVVLVQHPPDIVDIRMRRQFAIQLDNQGGFNES